MKIFKKLVAVSLIASALLTFAGCGNKSSNSSVNSAESSSSKSEYSIVASFYPMHILTMNLTDGISGVSVKSMSDPNMGCIHDHTFTTEDLKKVENANIFIENGLDLEVFNDKIKQAYPNTTIIEASKNITDTIKDEDEVNGHVWTNIDNYIKQVQYVSSQLQTINAENKDAYAKNEKAYVDKLNQLKSDYHDKLAKLAGKKALVLDETLPYFCDFTKIEEIEIETDHEQESLSADDLKKTIAQMNSKNIKSIFIGKNSDRANAEAIAKETGATIYELNTCMVGNVNKDSYITDMRENFEIVSNMQ